METPGRLSLLVTLCLVILWSPLMVSGKKPPNIIFVMADDVGYGDYQWNDPSMATPFLMELAQKGLLMNQTYSLHTCTPTRSAFLTGRYPYKFGLQVGKIKGKNLRYLDPSQKLLPEALKKLNYTTHAVGKWHLGHCHWDLTPRWRGFGSFYGFYTNSLGYFNFSGSGIKRTRYDFRDDEEVVLDYKKGDYSTELFTERVKTIIRKGARTGDPFFIYYAIPNAHAPMESKKWYDDKYCAHVQDKVRKTHCGMVAALDESIRNITRVLTSKGLDNDTIIIYMSDNGGTKPEEGSYNWPLRGAKATFFEGGMRSLAIAVYPHVFPAGQVWDGLFHVTDWYSTLLSLAGGAVATGTLDGIDQSEALKSQGDSRRTEMIYNIDDSKNKVRWAVRKGHMKLMNYIEWKPQLNTGWAVPPYWTQQGFNDEVGDETNTQTMKLFDLKKDPTEHENLINQDSYKSLVEEMTAWANKELQENLVPTPKPIPQTEFPDKTAHIDGPGWCCLN